MRRPSAIPGVRSPIWMPVTTSVQGVFNIYEQFHLASGKTVWLPPDKGEGQKWNRKPGNLFNKPLKVHFEPEIELQRSS